MLKVKLFAKARDAVGSPQIELPWTDGETVKSLKQAMMERHAALCPIMDSLLIAVNDDYASDKTVVKTVDEVACFPAVSGG